MGAVAPPRIHGDGTCEAAWRASPWLAGLRPCTAAGLLRGRGRVVLASPHPDDETLACGGLLQAAQAAGLPVVLLAATDGEACYPGDPAWTPDRLRDTRPREVLMAMGELGVDVDVRRLGLPDGGLAARAGTLRDALHDLVRPGDLLLAPWEADGHPDHDALGHAAVAVAARVAGLRLLRYPVWAWHWLSPDTPQPPFEAARLPLTPVMVARKVRAIECFASQLDAARGRGDGPAPILPPHVVERFTRPFEVYLP